jgi:hypothetical protein
MVSGDDNTVLCYAAMSKSDRSSTAIDTSKDHGDLERPRQCDKKICSIICLHAYPAKQAPLM